ncbi:DUF7363 domain-containing protein [Agromyces sp. SYSU T0242]|uniref:DUF7363 domain-containing protein n=1 Tax=Agromyces litoreus TaxID=3158561 RepID=UPI0033994AC8
MLQDRRVVAETATAASLQAELSPIVPVGSTATLVVRLVASDERPATGAARGGATVTVTVVPRGLRLVVGVRRSRRVRIPSRGAVVLRFPMIATDHGPGEVTVLARGDGEPPMATVRLTTEVVESDDHDQAGLARATVPLMPADAAIGRRPTLCVEEETSRGRSILHLSLSVGDERHGWHVRLTDAPAFADQVRTSIVEARGAGTHPHRPDAAHEIEHRLREVGTRLADRLLDRRARDLLWRRQDDLEGMVLQTTGETALPWEFMVLRGHGRHPAPTDPFLGGFGVVRWLTDVTNPASVRLSSGPEGMAPPRDPTAIASASVVALGVGAGSAQAGAAQAMRNGAGVVVECGGQPDAAGSAKFLDAFASELASGAPLDRASRRARETARAAGDACALGYAVYGHPDARAAA